MYLWFGLVLIFVFDEENYVFILCLSFFIDLIFNLIKEDVQVVEDILYL